MLADIPYTVVRSKRRRRTIEIRVDAERGVVLRAPMRTSVAELADLVQRRAGWIRERLQEIAHRPEPPRLASGALLPYLGGGVILSIEPTDRKRPSVLLDGATLSVQIPDGLEEKAQI